MKKILFCFMMVALLAACEQKPSNADFSLIMKLYGITGIPHTILFAPDGTILASDLHGHALDAFIENVLKAGHYHGN